MQYSIPLLLALLVSACAPAGPPASPPAGPDAPSIGATVLPRTGAVPVAALPGESRLANIRQLTHGGQNAEAYFSADGRRIIFQATVPGGHPCDRIFTMEMDGGNVRQVSTGEGRTTCGYFFPSGDRILYSSTHHRSATCPAPPDRSRGYVWPLDPYDIFIANADGSGLRQLTDLPGYDAEATISPDGRTIVFTSDRDGDLELYAMDADGSNVRRLTNRPGYDGGAFFSADGSRIVWRAHYPVGDELAEYRSLLREGLVRPSQVEIWTMNADGTGARQVTRNGAANFAPFFHPDGERIIFSSNLHDPTGRVFDLFMVGIDGANLVQITHNPGFDSFPMFSRDGRSLVWASGRGAGTREFNIFVADWVERP
jgi:TolB protein